MTSATASLAKISASEIAPLHIERVQAWSFRAPIEEPVRASFGLMRDRPAVIVRVTDRDGAQGWGEVWCNFPSVGAEHRARLAADVIGPLLLRQPPAAPAEFFARLTAETAILALQSGEAGPFAQTIAGIDQALWDVAARRAGLPLWRFLGGAGEGVVPVYASGINPDRPERVAVRARDEGHRRFKLKVGFGLETDLRNIETLRAELGPDAPLMIDANQAWRGAGAIEAARALEAFAPDWLEEPLPADAPEEDWRAIRDAVAIPLAGGENLLGRESFDRAVENGILGVIQPDLGKWGGLTGCLAVAREAIARGRRFCPHWLGGGLGLAASLHLLAAAGGDGIAEVDVNPNPLRRLLAPQLAPARDGSIGLTEAPGLGVEPDLASLEGLRTWPPR